MTTIKITQLPNLGNGLSASTILPVVNTSGTAVTAQVTVGAVANYVLTQAQKNIKKKLPSLQSSLKQL